jgi:hypothetical protein
MNTSSSSLEGCLETNRRLRRELEQQRRTAEESRQRLIDFVATSSDLIWETDADCRIAGTHLPNDVTSMSEQNELFPGKTIAQIADASNASDPLFSAHLRRFRRTKTVSQLCVCHATSGWRAHVDRMERHSCV